MTKFAVDELRYDERGLVPVVVQDAATREVLTVACMNAESLRRTLDEGETWFWSRSRASLWHKGETSGHTQRVVGVAVDCDRDALVVLVAPRGAACHTGARSCFQHEIEGARPSGEAESRMWINEAESRVRAGEPRTLGATLAGLYTRIESRRREMPEGSYTTYLFEQGLDKILKKVGEEAAETIIAAKNDDARAFAGEVSDLLYHLLVLMAERGVPPEEVEAELARREGKGVTE
ncbi:MAG TPA: bifunctional phosphoribosyl-AMP cyclohydrolase/phosphoribosyl-ATP diphosphatase HisIE [Pyrinomonadaceae bacterium]|jgi:phosphoribosyl-ATP pyrophosphohydrolase/phosphoribosyl-AMP cyclohydrolase|nr:bifunctional phosphoribosyl-AMP cyclohydrolase/phosphoribosyl-ATP diphosphatase HisIE [Pyrinomonadaceae bacterium]